MLCILYFKLKKLTNMFSFLIYLTESGTETKLRSIFILFLLLFLFKALLKTYQIALTYSYNNSYSPGFECQADFAGDILYITDKKTCIKTAVLVLCCILPCSSLSFVMALVNATKEHFYYGLDNPENMYPFLIRILVLYELIRWLMLQY